MDYLIPSPSIYDVNNFRSLDTLNNIFIWYLHKYDTCINSSDCLLGGMTFSYSFSFCVSFNPSILFILSSVSKNCQYRSIQPLVHSWNDFPPYSEALLLELKFGNNTKYLKIYLVFSERLFAQLIYVEELFFLLFHSLFYIVTSRCLCLLKRI
jgi:hypothetical protein